MNEIDAKITNIEVVDSISLIELEQNNQKFKTVVINSSDNHVDYEIDQKVRLIFKETEVILGKGDFDSISLQNRIPSKIKDIESGKILSKIYLSSDVGDFCSIITSKSVSRLNLVSDSNVTAMIKTNELMISK